MLMLYAKERCRKEIEQRLAEVNGSAEGELFTTYDQIAEEAKKAENFMREYGLAGRLSCWDAFSSGGNGRATRVSLMPDGSNFRIVNIGLRNDCLGFMSGKNDPVLTLVEPGGQKRAWCVSDFILNFNNGNPLGRVIITQQDAWCVSKIRVDEQHRKEIEQRLAEVNGSAEGELFTTYDQIAEEAKKAENFMREYEYSLSQHGERSDMGVFVTSGGNGQFQRGAKRLVTRIHITRWGERWALGDVALVEIEHHSGGVEVLSDGTRAARLCEVAKRLPPTSLPRDYRHPCQPYQDSVHKEGNAQ